MKRALVLTVSLAALLAAAPLALAEPTAPTTPAPVTVPPVKYSYRVLANGLKVYAIRDASSPNVAVQVWYQVGSKDDPVGRSGFAHLFEHMMFKATRDLPPESFDRMTEDVGGYNNASTNDDYTEYHEVVPANYLKTLLWAEAERMGALVVDDANFKSERDVVKEELRQRVLAAPYGRLFALDYPEISFQKSPYGRPGIGSIADLDSATLADVQAFHATYYRPDNAVLVVVGDFDPKQLDAWVDQDFGPIAKPAGAIPRVKAIEPRRSGPTRWTDYQPNTPLPAVLITYPFPPASSPDLPALIVADAILSKGESSRLYESLVYKQQVAQQAFSFLELRQQPGSYAVGAVMSDGKTPDQGETAVLAELARLRDEPVTASQLARAKNQLITDTLRQRETVGGKAEELETAIVEYGDPTKANRLISDIQAVTPADIQRVARKYLGDDQRAVVRYLSDDKKPADARTYAPAASIQAQTLTRPADMRLVQAAAVAERIKPPAPGGPVAAPQTQAVERTLANGLRVIIAPQHGVPLVSAQITVAAGGAEDPADLPGVSAMAATLLTKGTATRSAVQIAHQIESLGGALGAGDSYDGASLSLSVKRDELDPAMAIFADVARNPAFADAELERARRQGLNDIAVAMKDPAEIARLVSARAAYGAAPYGAPMGGTERSLNKLTRADVARFHDAWWRPDNATLVLTGDLTPDQGFALAERLFGDWTRPASPTPARPDPVGPVAAPQVIVVDLPDSGQAAVSVIRAGMARSDQRYYSAVLANSVLGGGYSGRLNGEIRVKRGLSYGANSGLDFRRGAGPLVATTQTKNESAVEVVGLIVQEMRKLGQAPAGDPELTARKAAVVGNFGRRVETTDDTAGLLSALALHGVDLGEVGRYADRVKAVSAADVQATAAQVFDPAQASIVVVGDSRVFLKDLQAKYPNLVVIPAADLDLESASLRKAKP